LKAGLGAAERLTAAGFIGARELDDLLAEGLASEQLSEEEFWDAVMKETDAMLERR
jgi:hypothetical protein